MAEIIQKVLPYDLFAILLYNDRRRDLRIRYAVGHRDEVVRNLSIALGEGITGTAAASREPVLVADVRNDPRYLNTVDAVRTELAVPMTARGKLVGVIDLQSTRVNAYTEYDRALLRLIAARVAIAIDNARLYRRVERQNRTLKTLANISREFSSILDLNELLGKIASTMRDLINYDAFSILSIDHEAQGAQAPLQHPLRPARQHRQRAAGQGHHRRRRRIARSGARARYRQGPALHRLASRHPLRGRRAADRAGSRGRRDGPGEQPHRLLHRRSRAHAGAAGAAGGELAWKTRGCTPSWRQRERRMEEDLEAARELQRILLPDAEPEIEGLEAAVRLRPAREISGDIYDIFEQRDGQTVIALGDVSGKGAAAALYGGLMSGLLRTLAPRRPRPAELMRALNDALVERRVEARYVTLGLLLWDATTRRS